jgi:putative methyltransferase (TIGR04325 family)
VGLAYYSYRQYLEYPEDFKWIVCDLPKAVEVGKKIAEKSKNTEQLSFITDLKDLKSVHNVFFTAGTLQYIEKSLSEIITEFSTLPEHILVQRVPVYDGKTYITLQNLINSAVPYKIQNRHQFIKEICDLGYELVDDWKNNRTCFIPFHPECFVDGYHGFYFRKKS